MVYTQCQVKFVFFFFYHFQVFPLIYKKIKEKGSYSDNSSVKQGHRFKIIIEVLLIIRTKENCIYSEQPNLEQGYRIKVIINLSPIVRLQ